MYIYMSKHLEKPLISLHFNFVNIKTSLNPYKYIENSESADIFSYSAAEMSFDF